jgi:hypothetical protein
MFDMLNECESLRRRAERGLVGFGINYVMVGPINKTLDLVLTSLEPGAGDGRAENFATMAATLGVVLNDDERTALEALPVIHRAPADDIAEVAVAVEAKACMTEHVKSLPRLHAEILATGYLARLAARQCITVSYSLVNSAPSFVTPSSDRKTNQHRQPEDARRVFDMLAKAVPTVSDSNPYGYDVVGAVAVDCRNDGSPVLVIEQGPASLRRDERLHYERMVRNLCTEYRRRFSV